MEVHAQETRTESILPRSPFALSLILASPSSSLFLSFSLVLSLSLSLSLFHAFFLLDSSSSIKNWSSTVSLQHSEPSFVNVPFSPFLVDCCSRSSLLVNDSRMMRHKSHTILFLLNSPFFSLSESPDLCSVFLSLSLSLSFCFSILLCAPELFLIFLYPKLQH